MSFVVGGFGIQKALIVLERIHYVSDPMLVPRIFGGPLIPSMAIILVFALLTTRFSTRQLVLTALGIGIVSQTLACLALLVEPVRLFPSEAALLFYNFLFPLSASTAVIPWVYLLARMNPLTAALANALCIIVSAVVVFGLESNDLPKFAIMMLISLFFTVFFFIRSDKDIPLKEGVKRWVFPYKAIIFVAAYSFSYGVSTITFAEKTMRFSAIIPAVLVVALVALNSKRFTLFTLCRIALPIALCGFFLVSFIPGLSPFTTKVILDSGDACLSMLVLLMACTIAFSTQSSPIWIFGLFYITQFSAQLIGAAAGGFAQNIGEPWYLAVIMAASIIVVATTFILSSERNLFSFWEHRLIDSSHEDLSPESLIELKVRCLGVTYGFTDREIEIVKLAAEGYTNTQIAREAFISEGTVKVHLHHVYQKMGIHTRKELLQMVQNQKKEVTSPQH